jgi:hypothetical protein
MRPVEGVWERGSIGDQPQNASQVSHPWNIPSAPRTSPLLRLVFDTAALRNLPPGSAVLRVSYLERMRRARDAILPRRFTHPCKIAVPLFFGHIKIYAGEFFAKGAHVEIALDLAKPRELFL